MFRGAEPRRAPRVAKYARRHPHAQMVALAADVFAVITRETFKAINPAVLGVVTARIAEAGAIGKSKSKADDDDKNP